MIMKKVSVSGPLLGYPFGLGAGPLEFMLFPVQGGARVPVLLLLLLLFLFVLVVVVVVVVVVVATQNVSNGPSNFDILCFPS